MVVLTVFACIVLIPFIYMVLISFKSTSELGSGRILPDAMLDFTTLSRGELVWLRCLLTPDQSAALNTITQVPVAPINSGPFGSRPIRSLPESASMARKLALEKPGIEAAVVIALFEVSDPNNAFLRSDSISVFYPGEVPGTWHATQATIVPRTLNTLLGRLFANYRSLMRWDDLRSGNILSWISGGYPRWYVNSLFVAFCTVALGLFFDSLAGFAFAKFQFPFRKILFGILLATIMIPYPVMLVPTFFVFAEMGFYNTYAALVVPGVVSAFGIFLVRQYVQGIPDDMLNAARIDGASDFGLYRHIILPTARPVLAALAVFRFIYQWNSYLFPLVLTNRDSMKTVQLGLATFQDAYGTIDYGIQMAGATLAIIPILCVYSFMQKHFIAGITLGSVKD